LRHFTIDPKSEMGHYLANIIENMYRTQVDLDKLWSMTLGTIQNLDRLVFLLGLNLFAEMSSDFFIVTFLLSMKLHEITPVVSLISSAETHPPSHFELRRVRPSLLRRSCRFGCEGRAHSSPGSRPGSSA